jgi:hypothetical protein
VTPTRNVWTVWSIRKMMFLTDCFYYCASWWHHTVSRQIDTCCVVSSHTLTSVLRGAKPAAAKISIRSSCWSRSVWLCWQSLLWSQTFVTHLIILCIIKRYDLSVCVCVCVCVCVQLWSDSSWTKDMVCYICYDGTKDIWKWFEHGLLYQQLTRCKIAEVIVR